MSTCGVGQGRSPGRTIPAAPSSAQRWWNVLSRPPEVPGLRDRSVGWVLSDVRVCKPIYCSGALGLWTLPAGVAGRLRNGGRTVRR